MKKVCMFAVLAFLILPAATVFAQRNELVLYTWDEMFPQKVFDDFERETGIKIVKKLFQDEEGNENMLFDLQSTGGAGADLVIADDYIIEFAITSDLAQKLNKRSLRNLGNVNPFYQHQFYDPNDEYTVPYGAGVQTLVYDPAKVKLNIKGFADLWDTSLRNQVGITANYRVINGMALKVLGKSYNALEVADISAAGQKLNALAPNVKIIRDVDLDRDLVSGNISIALMYTDMVMKSRLGDPDTGEKGNPNLKVVFPQEGIGFGIMASFIPKHAKNVRAAHLFLDFILNPQRGAECFEYLGYYCTFRASEQYIKPAYKEDLIIPPEFANFETMGRSQNGPGAQISRINIEIMQNLDIDAEEAHDKVWVEFRKIQEARR
jgi:spermidine/putrescine-binding protein